MLNQEETANIVQLLDDLCLDLRNGNVPAAKLLVISISNCLHLKLPIDWSSLGSFVDDNLCEYEFRVALIHLIPKLKELVCPFLSDQEASKE